MADPRVTEISTLSCSAAWRNYYFVKLTTADGTVGWSEFDEGFGSPGVGAVVQSLASRVVGQSVMQHERIREDLRGITRPGQGGVVGQALGAIENALLDAKAKTLGVPCYELLGGKVRDRMRVYWSHCVTWRAARRPHYQPEITDIDGVRALAREVRDKGFTGLKTNIFRYEDGKIKGFSPGFGTPFEPGLNVEKHIVRGVNEHLSVMREAAGPDMDILLDLNFNAKTEGYLRFLRGIADQDLFWVEIDTLDPHALAHIRSQSPHPIASCETLIGVQEFL
ncbi:MAG TPA: mandelate racemase/muconate lactonizing enzyme family protein, partial [Burkholderiaceae bacterium]|nr:mandelate racemase/muconate lactonizing enzyme family protein [Burkholderiaceae bacterium]